MSNCTAHLQALGMKPIPQESSWAFLGALRFVLGQARTCMKKNYGLQNGDRSVVGMTRGDCIFRSKCRREVRDEELVGHRR